MRGRRTVGALLVALALVLGGATAAAAAPQGVGCRASGDTRLPVLLVHGFNSSSDAWSPDTRSVLTAGGRACVEVFDYRTEHTRWVTRDAIGPSLARTIVALAARSAGAGGPGQVVVVGHSMGGLATRCAADPGCSGVPGVARLIRGVATLGTPHLGTIWKGYGGSLPAPVLGAVAKALCVRSGESSRIVSGVCDTGSALLTSDAARAFTPGSAEQRALPPFPDGVPVLALAGSLTLRRSVFHRTIPVTVDIGDAVVSEDSALAEWQRVGGLGGEKVLGCGTANLDDPLLSTVSCWHGSMTNDARFRAEVRRFVVALAGRPGRGTTTPPPVASGPPAPVELVAERHNESGSTLVALGWTPSPGATAYDVRSAAGRDRVTGTTFVDSRTASYCAPAPRYEVRALGPGGVDGPPATVTVSTPVDCTPEIRLVSVDRTADGLVADLECRGDARGGNGSGTVTLYVDDRPAATGECAVTDGTGVAGLSLTARAVAGTHRVQAGVRSPSGTKRSATLTVGGT